MGQLFSSLWTALFAGRELKIVMVGLDNAGKTTILYELRLGQTIETTPTVGSNVEQVKHGNLTFEVWDVGGQANLRPSWATYYQATDCIILVVDSTDRGRIGIAKKELQSLLQHEHLAGTPVLVFANKQDLRDAMSVEQLTNALQLTSIKKQAQMCKGETVGAGLMLPSSRADVAPKVDWHIQASCAVKGEGLTEGLDWVAQRLQGYKALPRRGMR